MHRIFKGKLTRFDRWDVRYKGEGKIKYDPSFVAWVNDHLSIPVAELEKSMREADVGVKRFSQDSRCELP